MLMPGMPARLIGIVQMSLRYIASGSEDFSPSFHATVGLVGVAITSTFAKASEKSPAILVRTRCAVP